MKTGKQYRTHFEKSSSKSTDEIKAACTKIKDTDKSGYDIKSNGNHIWVELDENKQQYWSPMLHLRLEHANNETQIKGEFAENPLLWIIFLGLKITSIGLFLLCGIVAYFKQEWGYNFNVQLFLMFAMVSVWFAMYLASERYKRKGAKQLHGFHEFVDHIAG